MESSKALTEKSTVEMFAPTLINRIHLLPSQQHPIKGLHSLDGCLLLSTAQELVLAQ